MNTRRLAVVALLVCLASLMSTGMVAQNKKFEAERKEMDLAAVAAWEKRGFKAGWLVRRTWYLEFTRNPEGVRRTIPGFRVWEAITDENLKNLPPVDVPFGLDLTPADLTNHKVTDAGVREITQHKNLVSLNLTFNRVTDAGIKDLAGHKNLSHLNLSGTGLTDAGLKALAGIEQLTSLHLRSTRVTDAGVGALAALRNLTALELDGSKISDAGLEELAGLKHLAVLSLSGTKTTGTGLKAFADHGNLVHLYLNRA